MKFPALAAGLPLLLVSCEVLEETNAKHIPGPAKTVTRHQAIAIAQAYAMTNWTAEERHRCHGPDSNRIVVHTPDAGMQMGNWNRGHWKVGQTSTGIPYKWGGFDTPRSFTMGLAKGKYAGDIPTAYKRRKLEAAVSDEAVGIDCSGLISRAWRLDRPYSTRELPELCDELSSYEQLDTGDILNIRNKHVMLFSHWVVPGKSFFAYEAAAAPEWRVAGNTFRSSFLEEAGYVPLRYRKIRDNTRSMLVNGSPYKSPFNTDLQAEKDPLPPDPAPALAEVAKKSDHSVVESAPPEAAEIEVAPRAEPPPREQRHAASRARRGFGLKR